MTGCSPVNFFLSRCCVSYVDFFLFHNYHRTRESLSHPFFVSLFNCSENSLANPEGCLLLHCISKDHDVERDQGIKTRYLDLVGHPGVHKLVSLELGDFFSTCMYTREGYPSTHSVLVITYRFVLCNMYLPTTCPRCHHNIVNFPHRDFSASPPPDNPGSSLLPTNTSLFSSSSSPSSSSSSFLSHPSHPHPPPPLPVLNLTSSSLQFVLERCLRIHTEQLPLASHSSRRRPTSPLNSLPLPLPAFIQRTTRTE